MSTALSEDQKSANAFVTFHVKSSEVVSNIQTIHRELLQFDSDFSHTFQPLQSLHVTLLIIHLNKQNFQNACEALSATVQHFQREHQQQFTVNFNGIRHNGEASMYAQIGTQSALWLTKLREIAIAQFESRGIPSLNPFKESRFEAHATILYLRSKSDRKLIKWWPEEEAKWEGRNLGTEHVKVLQICDIDLDDVTEDYKVMYEVNVEDHYVENASSGHTEAA
ncbi:A-kinase anchor protein 7 isoforms alpha and beta [Globodera pallida]|nr:A-kinase anchor protein 7 isoforms alpha and beta [Globodera pallida]